MNAYLSSHQAADKSECTHTRIGSPEHNVYGGSYNIPDLHEFHAIYCKHVFEKGILEHLTEKQLECGPLAIDLDFRYHEPKRAYTKDHILDFIDVLLFELHKLFILHENFPIYVFEKPNINCTSKCIKDGLHLIVGVNIDRSCKALLRTHLLEKMDIWKDLPLANDWNSVVDEGVFKGTTGWQLYGSRKPGHEAYELTTVIQCVKKGSNFEITTSSGKGFPMGEFSKLSVRNIDHETAVLKEEFSPQLETKVRRRMKVVNTDPIADEDITNEDQLGVAVDAFLTNLDPNEYALSEAHQYVMCLPSLFYDEYEKWIRVGWALHHTDRRLFLTWMKFSSQSTKFNFKDIVKLKRDWEGFHRDDGITVRSIMYWAKMNNPTEYEAIRSKSVDAFVENIIRESMCTEFDIAEVLFRLYKDEYVCVDLKSQKWFRYTGNRWMINDSGTDLRKQITDMKGIYGIFNAKRGAVYALIQSLEPDDPRKKELEKKKSKIESIMVNILKKQGDKIMKEASHKLYCRDFYTLLDSKKEILCFTNGVVDFNEKRFRPGVPEDYTHKHTRIPYIPLTECDPVIIEEVNTFMNQLFPDKELCDYMWQHAASILIGGNKNQTFHIYIGDGRNGKSKFAELISEAIGEYRATVPISLITGKRTNVGGATPEVAALVGIRYAVAQESSIEDAINEGPLKELTGGDTIQCRALYSTAIEFIPMFKLVMSTNNLPTIKGKDDGTWRRVRACEFKARFVESPDPSSKYQFPVDKNMDKKFASWKTVFMSMLVELAYKTNGNIVDCPMVVRNSERYRNDQDYLTSFVSSRIMENVSSVITDSQISAVFKEWWKEQYGNNPPKGKELFTYLGKLYADKSHVVRSKTSWKGLCLITEDEPIDGI